MRHNLYLLVSAVALVVVSAANENHYVKLLDVTTTDSVQMVDGTRERSGTRFLRLKEEDVHNDELDSAGEERNVGTLTKQFSKLESFKGLQKIDDLLTSAQSPKMTNVEKDLWVKINRNPVAKKFAKQFEEEGWDSQILKMKMGITPTTPTYHMKYRAFELLLQLRKYDDIAKTEDIGQKLLVKVTDDDLAKKFFGAFIDGKLSAQKVKTEMGITKNTIAGSPELNAYSLLQQSRLYFDTVLKSKTPSMSKQGQDILAKVDENPLAQKYFGQFMDDTLSQEALIRKVGLKPGGSTTSKEFEAVYLLVQARAFKSNFDTVTSTKTLPEKLLGQVNDNKLARNFFSHHMTEEWTTQTLKTQLGITKDTAVTSSSFEAFSILLKARLYTEKVANAKNPAALKQGQDMMTKLDKNTLAQQYFGEVMSGRLTLEALKTRLGITRTTPKTSKEYDTWFLLLQLRATSNGLDRV